MMADIAFKFLKILIGKKPEYISHNRGLRRKILLEYNLMIFRNIQCEFMR